MHTSAGALHDLSSNILPIETRICRILEHTPEIRTVSPQIGRDVN
jgi:hypothetical protein